MSQGFTNQQTYAVLPPTVQRFTSGSGTYTTPAGVKYIVVQMCGGGGGGAGSSTVGDGGTGGTGGNTTFGTSLLTANGGAGGTGVNPSVGGAGGTTTLNSPAIGINVNGQQGSDGEAHGGYAINQISGCGGNTPLSGAGSSVGSSNTSIVGRTAVANTGSGGSGAAYNRGTSGSSFWGAGGGAGGYIQAVINAPSATYSYSVGAGGTAGAAGTSGSAGGAGAAGVIIVTEYYDTIGIPSNLTLPIPVNQGGTGVTNSNWTAGSLTFSPTTQGIVGTTTNDSAGAGYVGEFISSERLSSSFLTLTIGAVTNVTSITLTAGDWDVWGNIALQFTNNNGDYAFGAINTTSATLVDASLMSGYQYGAITTGYWRFTVPYKRISVSSNTTTYLVVQAGGTGTVYAGGAIYARRVR